MTVIWSPTPVERRKRVVQGCGNRCCHGWKMWPHERVKRDGMANLLSLSAATERTQKRFITFFRVCICSEEERPTRGRRRMNPDNPTVWILIRPSREDYNHQVQ